MIVILDTTDALSVVIYSFDIKGVQVRKIPRAETHGDLDVYIALKKYVLPLSRSIRYLGSVDSRGSFSQVRLGSVVVNALGFAFQKKVFTISFDLLKGFFNDSQALITFVEATSDVLAIPQYTHEPNITR